MSIIIAIDGVSSSGKGTISEGIAKHFNIEYLDTGKLYRAVGYQAIQKNLDFNDEAAILKMLDQDGLATDISKQLLMYDNVGIAASKVSVHKGVRDFLYSFQKNFPIGKKACVIDGRDIGTVIFPNADIKLFITADLELRAKRRFMQLQNFKNDIAFADVLKDLKERDESDAKRIISPTKPALDAIVIDNSYLDVESMLHLAISLVRKLFEQEV